MTEPTPEKPYSIWGDPVEVIRKAGVWNLGRYGPCDCAHFEIQTVTVHVSCAGRDIEVTADEENVNRAMLLAVANEVRRQLAERTSDEWAATFPLKINGEVYD